MEGSRRQNSKKGWKFLPCDATLWFCFFASLLTTGLVLSFYHDPPLSSSSTVANRRVKARLKTTNDPGPSHSGTRVGERFCRRSHRRSRCCGELGVTALNQDTWRARLVRVTPSIGKQTRDYLGSAQCYNTTFTGIHPPTSEYYYDTCISPLQCDESRKIALPWVFSFVGIYFNALPSILHSNALYIVFFYKDVPRRLDSGYSPVAFC